LVVDVQKRQTLRAIEQTQSYRRRRLDGVDAFRRRAASATRSLIPPLFQRFFFMCDVGSHPESRTGSEISLMRECATLAARDLDAPEIFSVSRLHASWHVAARGDRQVN
jgi:hypothetical protein